MITKCVRRSNHVHFCMSRMHPSPDFVAQDCLPGWHRAAFVSPIPYQKTEAPVYPIRFHRHCPDPSGHLDPDHLSDPVPPSAS